MSAGNAPPRLSIVWATLNERGNLPELVERLRATTLPPWEVIVVDDGSTDGTRPFLADLAEVDPRFRVLLHDGKQTTIRAQAMGIEASRAAYVVIMDADQQHPPESLPAIVAALDAGAEVVVASRYAPGGSPGPRTLGRRVLSRGAEWLARRALPEARRVTDPVSGYFGFRREVYRSIDPGIRGYKLLLFVLAMGSDRRLAEVGFRFVPRGSGRSKVTASGAFIRLFLRELRLARRLRRAVRARG
jgi:dolichol-phosphate mannosyltransferase